MSVVAKAVHAELGNLNLVETNGEMLSNSRCDYRTSVKEFDNNMTTVY